MSEIKKYIGRGLSCFRTLNIADYFAEIKSPQDALEAFAFAEEKNLKAFVLGGGSNVFFPNKRIGSLILKNALPRLIEPIGDDLFKVSSSTTMMDFLNYAYKDSRDACYYLASAPCQIGGAIAMNAGSGKRENKTISDYIESVEVLRDGVIYELKRHQIKFDYRHSEFSDAPRTFIISAIFKLPKASFLNNPISERLKWAKQNQDLNAPNCGSLCNTYNATLMKITRALYSPFNAGLSKKKLNWAYNKSANPRTLRLCLKTLSALHKLCGKKLKFEIKIVK